MISLNNFQRILVKFGLWLVTGILICLVGVTGVFADTYYTNYFSDIYYYDNNGSSISAVTTQWNESLQSYISNNITTVANSYGAGVGFNSPIQLIKNHTYTFSISFPERNNIALSSKMNIALGNGPYNSGYNYTQNNYHAETLMASIVKGNIIQYSFTATDNYGYIFMPWTTTSTSTQNYFFNQIIIDDLGSEGVSISDINSSLSNQTTILNNSISNSTNTITQNSNANRDLIINNQNQNTQQQIESQKVCNIKLYDKTSIIVDGRLNNNGSIIDTTEFGITDYIKINTNSVITVVKPRTSAGSPICFYDDYKSVISCTEARNYTTGDTLTIPNNSYYVRFTIHKSTDVPQFNIKNCFNGNQALDDSINDLNNTLNDDDSSGASSEASDFFSSFNTNTFGLTSIITAPLNLIQSLTSSTCSQLHLPLPYLDNKYLDLPCMSNIYSQYFGSFFTIYQTITYGIIAYWVCVRIFNLVKDFKNPEHDEIEVVDL